MNRIYLDHAASSPLHPKVAETMINVMKTHFGNPSSVHQFGREARKLVVDSRRIISRVMGAQQQEVMFTSGGTESNSTAIRSAVEAQKHLGNHIITTKIEHPSVLETCKSLMKQGMEVTFLPVDEQGRVSIVDVQSALTPETILVSILAVNNETGSIQPIREIARLLEGHHALFHTDAVQAFGKLSFDLGIELGVDMLTATAHKINGPKGIGLLYVKAGTPFAPVQVGGEQERKRRAGTEDVASIVGFGKAIEVYMENKAFYNEQSVRFKQIVLDEIKAVDHWVNSPAEGSAHVVNMSFPKVNIESLLTNLDLAGVAVSSGSACSAGSHEPSHVLTAMFGTDRHHKEALAEIGEEIALARPGEEGRSMSALRLSFGLGNTEDEVRAAAKIIVETVKKQQNHVVRV